VLASRRRDLREGWTGLEEVGKQPGRGVKGKTVSRVVDVEVDRLDKRREVGVGEETELEKGEVGGPANAALRNLFIV
jgi:hypothetical protein